MSTKWLEIFKFNEKSYQGSFGEYLKNKIESFNELGESLTNYIICRPLPKKVYQGFFDEYLEEIFTNQELAKENAKKLRQWEMELGIVHKIQELEE